MDSPAIIQLIVLLVLLFFSGFFSSAETALTTVNRIKIKNMAEDGDAKAVTVLKVIERPKKMLSAILIGNNIVNLSAASLATTLAVRLLGSYGAGIATGVLTLLILIFGEITPKSVATSNSVKLSLRYAPIIHALMIAFTPVITVINFLAGFAIRLFGIDPDFSDDTITEEEIRTMVDESHEMGEIEKEERAMIHKVFDFSDATAKEVMIPRIDMTIAEVDWSYQDLIACFRENMYTRLPVREKDSDDIIGVINMKDFVLLEDTSNFSIRDHLRDVYFTFEMKNVSELFDEMRQKSLPFTIVLDEYGSLSGMITLEDLLEELVGEIRDEYDSDEEDDLVRLNDREFKILGSMNLEDLCNILPLGFESEDYDTIGGYLTGAFDHFPSEGEIYISKDGAILKVEEVENKRIVRINLKLPQEMADQLEEMN